MDGVRERGSGADWRVLDLRNRPVEVDLAALLEGGLWVAAQVARLLILAKDGLEVGGGDGGGVGLLLSGKGEMEGGERGEGKEEEEGGAEACSCHARGGWKGCGAESYSCQERGRDQSLNVAICSGEVSEWVRASRMCVCMCDGSDPHPCLRG